MRTSQRSSVPFSDREDLLDFLLELSLALSETLDLDRLLRRWQTSSSVLFRMTSLRFFSITTSCTV